MKMLGKLISKLFSFKGLYVAFFIAVVFYGQVRLMFGLTPRHIAIVVMLIACMRQGIPFPMGRIIKAYLLFIFTFLVSATLTGYLEKVLITYYIAALVGYWATKILVVKYKDDRLLLNTVIVLGVINAIITIGQTFNLSISDQLLSLFHLKLPDKYIDKMDVEGSEDLAFMLARPGLFRSAVYNGYFLMTSGVASLILFIRKLWIQRFIPWTIITFGCICVQERGPIIILMVLSAFAFYKIPIIKKRTHTLLLLLVLLVFHFISESISSLLTVQYLDRMETRSTAIVSNDNGDDMSDDFQTISSFTKESRFAELGLDDTGRGEIYSQATEYLMDHPFIAGYHRFAHMYKMAPHNLFLNAFIYGGVVGGFAILFILFWQIKPLWRVFLRRIADTNHICFFAGLAFVAFTLNSLVHNRSVVTGDELLWMLWAAFYFEYRKFFRRDARL